MTNNILTATTHLLSIIFKEHGKAAFTLIAATAVAYFVLPYSNRNELRNFAEKQQEMAEKLSENRNELRSFAEKQQEMAEKQQEMAEKLKEVAEKMKEVADNVKRFLSMNDEKYNELKESQETLRNSLIDIPERITAIEYRLNTVGVQTEIQ